ncbi:MAG: alpha/beta hydrolase [Candidatus Levybacteria bacterium]|nr:alpha/beta hydrolase [Candidatus Levybacteria bacterium]
MKNSKPKIFILHGWTYSKDRWNSFLSLLKSKGLNPYLLSIPGLTGEINKPWTIDDYIKWLLQTLKEEEKVILICHSNGGRIALNFVGKYPEKTEELILIDSAGIYHNDIYIKLKRNIFLFFAKVGKKIIPFDIAQKLLYSLTGEKDYFSANQNMKKTMVNLLQSDKSLNLSKTSVPTLIIWGREDDITPLSDGELLNNKIVNSKLFVVNGAKHSPQFTHSEEVVNIITEQLNKITT